MTDYSELVKALRCGEYKPECGSSDCPYWSGLGCMDGQLMEDAAAAIEELQKDLTTIQKCYEIADTTVDEVLKQLPKLGEWELIDGAEPMRWGCSRCKYLSWETSNYCPRCGAKMEVQE